MIEFSEASIKTMIVHYVGNKVQAEGVALSTKEVNPHADDFTTRVLMHYFLSPFKGNSFYHLSHPSSLDLNGVYRGVSTIFDNEADFTASSKFLAEQLYQVSEHPNIKGGDLYVVLLKDVIVEGEVCDAIGLFKSENSQPFINVRSNQSERYVVTESGVNPTKLDKGCLIFNTEREAGFKVCVVDNTSKSSEVIYWKDAFLQVKPREDSHYQTRGYMEVCKGFVKEVFNTDNDVDRADQVVMLNKAAEYFKTNEVFEEANFEATVMEQPEIIEAFREYKDKYQTMNQMTFKEEFSIATDVAKKMGKQFKSVIKLDKNFHINLHGNRELMEKGYDAEKKMSFYKLYYDEELL